MSDLEKRVAQLEALVQKQQALLAKSGEQLMKLSLSQQRSDIDDLDRRNKDLRQLAKLPTEKQSNDAEYFTQDDVVELVAELQGQLDIVDFRCQLRIENACAITSSDEIKPVPNQAGDIPERFPTTLGEFEKLIDSQATILARFYELLPPDINEIGTMLAEANISPSSEEGREALEKARSSEAELKPANVFNTLAKYIGVKSRKDL